MPRNPNAPGADDPRYWERLRAGPPLDEWERVPSAAERSARRRAEYESQTWLRRHRSELWNLLILVLLVGGFFLMAHLDDGGSSGGHEDGHSICVDERGEYPC